jgi:hypothetical protein
MASYLKNMDSISHSPLCVRDVAIQIHRKLVEVVHATSSSNSLQGGATCPMEEDINEEVIQLQLCKRGQYSGRTVLRVKLYSPRIHMPVPQNVTVFGETNIWTYLPLR